MLRLTKHGSCTIACALIAVFYVRLFQNKPTVIHEQVDERSDRPSYSLDEVLSQMAKLNKGPEQPAAWGNSSRASQTKERIFWCQLDKNNTSFVHFHHLPHAAQMMYPCWSFLSLVPQSCGFQLHPELPLADWTRGLIEFSGCHLTRESVDVNVHVIYRPVKTLGHYTTPGPAKMLQDRLPRKRPTDDKVRIHITQREGRRSLENLEDIELAIRRAFPDTVVIVAKMEDKTLVEQFQFWNEPDVMVTPHGAAIAHSLFIRNTSVLIEVCPPHYCPDFFRSLLDRLEIHHLCYYDILNATERKIDFDKEHVNRTKWMDQVIQARVDDIVDMVGRAIEHTKKQKTLKRFTEFVQHEGRYGCTY